MPPSRPPSGPRRCLSQAVSAKVGGSRPTDCVFADRRVFDSGKSGERRELCGGRLAGGDEVRHARHGWFLHAAGRSWEVQGIRSRPFAGLQLFRRGGRGGGQSRDRHCGCPPHLDRSRHRPVHQSGAGDRADRGQHLHGPGRGLDGGDGLPRATATWFTSSPRSSNTRARPRWRCAT